MNDGRVLKRLGKDYEQMLRSRKKFISYSHGNNFVISVDYTDKLELKIYIDDHYPFRSPYVYVNGETYCAFIQKRMNSIGGLTTHLNVPCPCCYNILNSWSPSYYISSIFHEFDSSLRLINTFQKLKFVNQYLLQKFEKCDNIFILRLIYNYLE